jgi:hypothetical protein
VSCHIARHEAGTTCCQACTAGVAETEQHFFVECPAYSHIRANYPAIFDAHSRASVSDCMRSAFTYPNLPHAGHFVYHALRHRSQILHQLAGPHAAHHIHSPT